MVVKEIKSKAILSASQIYDYALNPYVGCIHGCAYCYARFMKKFTGHREQWGEFVDVKINAVELLAREITRKKKGTVWISGVCDPYQHIEERYVLTGRCLEILTEHGWPIMIQTKSPLVLRDMDMLKKTVGSEVGFTITTADEKMRKIFEAHAPPIEKRIEALGILHEQGIETYVMIAPLLPGAEGLPEMLKDRVDHVLIDRYNYHYADRLYRKRGMERGMDEAFLQGAGENLRAAFEREGIPCRKLY